MKKVITLALGIFLLASCFLSCKKGDNDPFLSLMSRKARLVGSWHVSKREIIATNINGTTTIKIQSIYDGTQNITTTTTIVGTVTTSVVDTMKYSESLDINKDGTYKLMNMNANQLDVDIAIGRWMFIGKSKLDNLKKKEAILMTLTQSIISNGSSTNTVNYTDLNGSTVVIDELKNKGFVTIVQEDSENSTGLVSSKKTTKTTYN